MSAIKPETLEFVNLFLLLERERFLYKAYPVLYTEWDNLVIKVIFRRVKPLIMDAVRVVFTLAHENITARLFL